jgi:hypothetical protein
MFMQAQLGSDDFAGNAGAASKNDPEPLGHGSRYTLSAHLPFQIVALFSAQNQRRRRSASCIRHRCASPEKAPNLQ